MTLPPANGDGARTAMADSPAGVVGADAAARDESLWDKYRRWMGEMIDRARNGGGAAMLEAMREHPLYRRITAHGRLAPRPGA